MTQVNKGAPSLHSLQSDHIRCGKLGNWEVNWREGRMDVREKGVSVGSGLPLLFGAWLLGWAKDKRRQVGDVHPHCHGEISVRQKSKTLHACLKVLATPVHHLSIIELCSLLTTHYQLSLVTEQACHCMMPTLRLDNALPSCTRPFRLIGRDHSPGRSRQRTLYQRH